MGVRTEADEQLDTAREAVNTAIKALSKVVIERVWGTDEYSSDYVRERQVDLNTLLDVRTRLGG